VSAALASAALAPGLGAEVSSAGFLGAWLLAGCGAVAPRPTVARRMGGERHVGAFVSPTSYELFLRAELSAAAGRWEEAVEQYRYALAGAEEDTLVLARLAVALERAGRPDAADEALERAFGLDADAEAALLARAEIADARGRLEEAVAALERAMEVAPASADPPLRLAELLGRMGAGERAFAVLERAAREGDGRSAVTTARLRLRLALARDDARQAGNAALELLRVAPVDAPLVRQAAERALAGGEPLVALRVLEALPERAAAPALRVRAALAAGAPEVAEGLLATTPPDALGGPAAAARLWLAAGRPERALELALEAAAATPGPEAHLAVAAAARALGRADLAARHAALVPAGAAEHEAAVAALAEALADGGHPALGREVLRARGAAAPAR
jgi:tetratricopeptide (TPR) repeat protein